MSDSCILAVRMTNAERRDRDVANLYIWIRDSKTLASFSNNFTDPPVMHNEVNRDAPESRVQTVKSSKCFLVAS